MQQRRAFHDAIFGNEEENESIHHAQELGVEVVERERPTPQRVAKFPILRMADESLSQRLERLLDALPQSAEDARAVLGGDLCPFLQPAGLRLALLALLKPRRVRG